MTDPMTIQRFRALTEIYGAGLERWPVTERVAAERLLRDPVAMQVLREAHALDAAMNVWKDTPVPADLFARVAAALDDNEKSRGMAGREKRDASQVAASVGQNPLKGIGHRLWWLGVGLAAAVSGLAAGSVAASTLVQDDPYDAAVTSFGNLPDLEK
ncbi:hypothetical protein [Rhizobium sp. 9140]|uniref:hypothetical protein n=1 Tax=Rhizobium sp. 9140 TaxID=1761900 RepID=UPI000792A386|nr:hypothetical protein [Rhizobium sp. 9140]CZT37257.1 hypothetical protein GA0004734_00042190 [Rhizobium sp. 9140]